jgi:5-hydroxyisourate hydrolase
VSSATISTHVLDTSLGKPAARVAVRLSRVDAGAASEVARAVTNADGRVASFDGALEAGHYRLTFDVAPYFAATNRMGFYAEIAVDFVVAAEAQHYHVPLLLSPYGYSTYRGS